MKGGSLDLFESAKEEMQRREAPLATRMRPLTLQEFVGQKDVVGEGTYLRRAIEEDKLQTAISGDLPARVRPPWPV